MQMGTDTMEGGCGNAGVTCWVCKAAWCTMRIGDAAFYLNWG